MSIPAISKSLRKNLFNNNGGVGIIILIIVIGIFGAAGYWGYTNFFSKNSPGKDFVKEIKHVDLREEILLFSYKKLPKVYFGFLKLNSELLIINKEIGRLEQMEKEYPQQLTIIASEKYIWEKIRQDILSTLNKIEYEIEAIFVTNKVNPEKGAKRIEEKKEVLQESTDNMLEKSQIQTKRLTVTKTDKK